MSDLFDSIERKTPDSWASILGKVPLNFRETLLQYAWDVHDKTMTGVLADSDRARGHDHITAQSTAMSELSYAAFMPLHLVRKDDQREALQVLSGGTYELVKWIRARYPDADNVLIVGDQPHAQTLADRLDELFDESPARRLVCGPGASVEAMVRAYAEERNFGTAQIGSIDERRGPGWVQTPGPRLEKMVNDLFRQFTPARVVAFEPVQMPATHLAMEKAIEIGIPVLRIEAPSAKARIKP